MKTGIVLIKSTKINTSKPQLKTCKYIYKWNGYEKENCYGVALGFVFLSQKYDMKLIDY